MRLKVKLYCIQNYNNQIIILFSCNLGDIEEMVMGIAHRGRLNLMVCFLDLDPALLFTKVFLTFDKNYFNF